MIGQSDDARRVLPRWHSPRVSAGRAETHSLEAPAPQERTVGRELAVAIDDWKGNSGWKYSSDLVSLATVVGGTPEAREAAGGIITSQEASALARSVAHELLSGGGWAVHASDEVEEVQSVRPGLAAVRAQLRLDPRNALAWLEQARLHTVQGRESRAKQCMATALGLSPDSRLVIRSAVRLYSHLGDPERAHRTVAASTRVKDDPWLMAAEISTASLAGRQSLFAKRGRTLIEREQFHPRHATELASALATQELEAGGEKRARRLFALSLDEPNDNALAQAEWASGSHRLSISGLVEHLETSPESWEARALAASTEGRSDEAISHAWRWFFDEPFSIAASMFGSHVAARARAFEQGVDLARRGLDANPRNPQLVNNYAFCLARLGRVREAETALKRVDVSKMSGDERGFITATAGLIAFRRGDPERGRERYLEALDQVSRPTNKVLALVMLAAEEARIRSTESLDLVPLAWRRGEEALQGSDRAWLAHLPF